MHNNDFTGKKYDSFKTAKAISSIKSRIDQLHQEMYGLKVLPRGPIEPEKPPVDLSGLREEISRMQNQTEELSNQITATRSEKDELEQKVREAERASSSKEYRTYLKTLNVKYGICIEESSLGLPEN